MNPKQRLRMIKACKMAHSQDIADPTRDLSRCPITATCVKMTQLGTDKSVIIQIID